MSAEELTQVNEVDAMERQSAFAAANGSMLFRFLNYQREFIECDDKIQVVEKGRQEGLSWAAAYKVVRDAHRSKTPKIYYWLSRDEELAKMALLDVMMWLRVFGTAANHMEEDLEILGGERKGQKVQTTKVVFENGATLYCLSSSVDAVIGRRGCYILDEFAVHKDQEQLFNLVLPAIKTGAYWLAVISTHRSKQTFFYKLTEQIREGKRKAKLFTFPITRAIDDGLVELLNYRKMLGGENPQTRQEFLDSAREDASCENLFLQEYMCIPADAEQLQAVREEDIDKCCVAMSNIKQSNPVSGSKYFMGVDIGRHRDLTVITVLELVEKNKEPHFIMRYQKTISQAEFVKQESIIYADIRKWKPYGCHIDGTNTGAQIAESMANRISSCESIKITATTKPVIVGTLIRFFEKGFIQIFDTQELTEDCSSILRYIAKDGKINYDIPSRGGQGHGDRFMSMALAVHAATSKNNRIGRLLQDIGVQRDTVTSDEKKKRISEIGRVIKQRKRFRI